MGLYPVAVCYNARQDNTKQYNTIHYNNTHHTKQHTALKATLKTQNYKKKSGTHIKLRNEQNLK